ncbi:MAG: type II toxin-antitoxin system VapC family toxin [Chloroflexota bacterium]|nr:type II toxin-antitoxin system VapC family toxin [Chloroflexota bacterium]
MRYLVDTDWVIDYMHGVRRVADRIAALTPDGIGMSVVTLGELVDGVYGDADPQMSQRELDAFLQGVDLLDVDEEIARIFGRERRRLRVAGNLIGDMDLLIGATALRHGLTVLTNNRRHFERIEGLAIESV